MSKLLLLAGAVAIGAVYFGDKADSFMAAFERANQSKEVEAQAVNVEPVYYGPAGSEVLQADRRGHFLANFEINGRSVNGMVDTGATFVAMNERTARRVGISISGLDFIYAVNTANGKTEAAHVNLSRMELGSIRVQNIEAFVLRDNSLSDTILVGMSFMRKLESFKVEDNQLFLKN